MSTTPADEPLPTAPPSTDPFRALIDHHARWVFAAAYRQLRDTHLAEDATQTVFILLHQRSQRMQPTPKLKLSGWLFNTLQFTIKNLRREQRRRAAREREIAAQRTTSAPSTDTTTDLHDQLDTAVATLSDTDRTAILLRFYQDLPFDKIAATLQISEPAARKRVTRAVHALRKHLRLPSEESAAAGSLALAATHGLSHTPATLTTTIATTSAAATLPATTAATLKGVTTLMALAKLQTAAILAAATLLILIPATIIAIHHHLETTPIAAAPTASQPEADDPNAPYVLPPNRVLINITNPPKELHDQLNKEMNPSYISPGNLVIEETDTGDLRAHGRNEKKWSAGDFLKMFSNLFPYQDFDPALSTASATWILDGDLLYRANATPEQYLADLQTILHDNLHLSATISAHDIPQKVIVFRGQWKYTPDPSEPSSRGNFPDILLYDTTTPPPHPYGTKSWGNGSSATEKSFPGQVAGLIQQPVLLDVLGFPSLISVEFDTPTQKMNRDALLHRISEQTGLTWTEETRTLRQFSLTTPVADTRPLDDSLDTFTRLYALAPGQLLRHIQPIDRDLRVTLLLHYGHMGVSRNIHDVVYWRNNDVIGTGNLTFPTYPLQNLATQFFRIQNPQLESSLANTPLSGDFSYRAEKGITPDQYIAPFKQILRDDFHLDPAIEFLDVPRKVLVLHGPWTYTPSPDLLPAHFKNDNDGQPLPCIDFYSDPATTPHSLRSTICGGGGDTIASTLAWWLHEDTFIEATGIPDQFATREPRSTYEDSPFLTPEDKASLLQHVTQQTGLTLTEETRTVHHLFIEPATTPAPAPAK